MHSFLKAFEDARKKGKFDPKTQQNAFHFSYEKYNINNVNLLITKKPLDKRFKVDVLMNLDDRRSVILKSDDDLARIHAILQVTLPVVEYDVHGHTSRHDGRRSKIDAAMRELKNHKYAEFVASTGLTNQEACESVHKLLFSRNSQTYMRFMDELTQTSFSFKDVSTIDCFSYVLLNSCCMIVKHFTKTDKGRIDRLPGKYYHFYVDSRNADRLPAPIGDAKVALSEILRYYGNYKFYNFCSWIISIAKLEHGENFDQDIICALEDERMAKRTMKFDKTSAPSGRRDHGRNKRNFDTDDNVASDNKPSKPSRNRVPNKFQAKPSSMNVSLGDMFGAELDQAFGDK